MKAHATTALGIDIGEEKISLVLLGKTKEGLRVLDAARVPAPEGAIDSGRVVDEASLLKALKSVKRCNKTRTRHIALSLPVGSMVSRVIRLDEEDPQRIAQYVRNEIREYAAFSGRETVSDFHVVAPARYNAPGRVFLCATDNGTVTTATRACRRAGLSVGAIESAGMACARVVGDTGPVGKSVNRSLLAVLKDGVLSLYVFRRGMMDFIRTERMGTAPSGSDGAEIRLAAKINAVVAYCQGQVDETPESWSVVIVDDNDGALRDDVKCYLKANVTAATVDIRTRENAVNGMGVDPRVEDEVSITALGLAMRFLIADEHDRHTNLLPPEATRDRSTRKNVLIAANTLACLMLVVILIMGGLRLLTKQVNQDIAVLQQGELKRGEQALSVAVDQLAYIEQRNESLASEVASLERIAASHCDVQWTPLLNDIGNATPEFLCVTNLNMNGGSGLSMEGLSYSYEAVRIFVRMLAQSEQIEKASIVEVVRSVTHDGLVQYTVRCMLVSGKAV